MCMRARAREPWVLEWESVVFFVLVFPPKLHRVCGAVLKRCFFLLIIQYMF